MMCSCIQSGPCQSVDSSGGLSVQVYGYNTTAVEMLAQPGVRRGSTYNCTCKSSGSGVRRTDMQRTGGIHVKCC
jgi:hypothetical protein